MTTVAMPMASPNLLKRPFDHIIDLSLDESSPHEDAEHNEWQSDHMEATPSDQSLPQLLEQVHVKEANQPNPPSTLSVIPHVEDQIISAASSASSAKPTNKRQKLIVVEQETRQKEKEIKDRQKAEEKAKKDDEKEEKRRVREAHMKAKEEEKIQKEKACNAFPPASDSLTARKGPRSPNQGQRGRKTKERRREEQEGKGILSSLSARSSLMTRKSQLRLNSFFVQKPSAESPGLNSQSLKSSLRSSTSSMRDGIKSRSRSVSPKDPKAQSSEYERLFPPFYMHMHTTLAPETRFSRDEAGLKYARIKIDEHLQSSEDARPSLTAFNPFELLHIPPRKRSSCGSQRNTVKDLVARIHGTSQNPIDLTESRSKAVDKPTALLVAIPIKYLSFAEDVRPPYIGTYTKVSDPQTCSKLRRNPFTRSLPTNYDYDSEAEWEEPGEGEELDSEGEEEVGEEDEEDEMEGFLDDEEAGDGTRMANAKSRLVASDLQPLSTGVCWENSQNEYRCNEDQGLDPQSFRLKMISGKRGNLDHASAILTGVETFQLPIDPYSTAYWQPRALETFQAQGLIHAPMDPPRVPLSTISRTNNLTAIPSTVETLKAPSAGTEMLTPAKPSQAPKRLIADDALDAFKIAIAGSDLTKAGLVEVLKKQ